MRWQVLTQLSLLHLLRANTGTASTATSDDGGGASDEGGEALKALRCAEQALCMSSGVADPVEAVLSGTNVAGLINFGVAALSAQRASASDAAPDAAAAAASAKPALERAIGLAGEDHEARGRALLALAGAHELLGDVAGAASHARSLLEMMRASGLALPEASLGHVATGDACLAGSDHAAALAAFYEALATSGV